MAQQHVAQFVSHDARDLAFVMRRLDHSAVDEHRAARKRERVNLLLVDHAEGVMELGVLVLRRNCANQPLSDAGQVFVQRRVVEHREFLLNLLRSLLPKLYIVRRFVLVRCRGDDVGLRGCRAKGNRQQQDRNQTSRVAKSGHG